MQTAVNTVPTDSLFTRAPSACQHQQYKRKMMSANLLLQVPDNDDTLNRENRRLGKAVAGVLDKAIHEQRVTCGLLAAIRQLELDPCRIAFCLLPQQSGRDTASHIHKVLLQAFCLEQNIAIIHVDSVDRLRHHTKAPDCSCVVVLNPWNQSEELSEEQELLRKLHSFTSLQNAQPIIKLPAK